jgi:hypothetical protein
MAGSEKWNKTFCTPFAMSLISRHSRFLQRLISALSVSCGLMKDFREYFRLEVGTIEVPLGPEALSSLAASVR